MEPDCPLNHSVECCCGHVDCPGVYMSGCVEATEDPLYMSQMEAGYNEYAALREMYEQLIKKDPDPNRVIALEKLLDWLNEDNK